MTNNQRAMYAGLCFCRNTEVAQRWLRTQVFLLIHSAGLSFTLAQSQPTFTLFFFMSLGGLVLAICWFLANWRTDQWIVYWQARLVEFEKAEPEPAEIKLFSGPEWDRMKRFWFSFNVIANALITFFSLLWCVVLVRAFFI